jgi:hypothetical protein
MAPAQTHASADRRIEILKSAAAAFRRRGYHGASVTDRQRPRDDEGEPVPLLPQQGRDPLRLPRVPLDVLLALLADVRAETSTPDHKLRPDPGLRASACSTNCRPRPSIDLQALSPPLLRKIIARRDEFDRGLREIIQQGMDARLRAGQSKMVAFAVMGAVNWITKCGDPAGPMTSDAIGQAFADYLVGGLTRMSGSPCRRLRRADRERYSAVSPGFSASTWMPSPRDGARAPAACP